MSSDRWTAKSLLRYFLPLSAVVLIAAVPADGCEGGGEGDLDGDGYTAADGDCNDANPNVNPGATEVCGDGLDNDCDGVAESCGGGGDAEACYLGADRRNNTCYDLDPIGNPPPSGYSYSTSCVASYGSGYATPDHLLDLNDVSPSELLAPNFRADELAQSWKGRYAVLQPHAVSSLQTVRDVVGPLVVNSGYRSPSYNASVDGASCSRHMYGDAFDLDPSSVSLSALGDACYARGASYVQLYESHVHCDWREVRLDSDFFRITDDAMVAAGFPELGVELLGRDGVWTAPAFGWDEGEPLRQWRALDDAGHVIADATGRSFAAPADTAFVEVVVGGEIFRRSPAH